MLARIDALDDDSMVLSERTSQPMLERLVDDEAP